MPAALLFAALLIGCTPAPRPPAAPVTAAPGTDVPIARRLCHAVHAVPMERRRECCPGAPQASLEDACTAQLEAALARGQVVLDSAAVDRCAAGVVAGLEGCGWVTPLLPGLPEVCGGLARGKVPAGERCESSLECEDGHFCRGLSPGRPGACAPPAPIGAPCATPSDPLAVFTRTADDPRHTSCAGKCVLGKCIAEERGAAAPEPTALKEKGAPCKGPFECRAAACLKGEGEETGKCGDPCGAAAP